VIVTHGAIDELEVYRGLGVREGWLFEEGASRVVTLRGDGYVPIERSAIFVEVDLARVAHYTMQEDQHVAVRAFRDELRAR